MSAAVTGDPVRAESFSEAAWLADQAAVGFAGPAFEVLTMTVAEHVHELADRSRGGGELLAGNPHAMRGRRDRHRQDFPVGEESSGQLQLPMLFAYTKVANEPAPCPGTDGPTARHTKPSATVSEV